MTYDTIRFCRGCGGVLPPGNAVYCHRCTQAMELWRRERVRRKLGRVVSWPLRRALGLAAGFLWRLADRLHRSRKP